jgi:hypothetical protein
MWRQLRAGGSGQAEEMFLTFPHKLRVRSSQLDELPSLEGVSGLFLLRC